LNGGHLVLFGEQGHGDVLQFIRFAQMAREQAGAGRVSVVCHEALMAVVAQVSGVDDVYALDDEVHAVDACAPLMSLPVHLWQPDSVVMPTPPYLSRPNPRALTGLGTRGGLVWRGNPEHAKHASRSCLLSALMPLFNIKDAHFYALQWGGMNQEELACVEGLKNVTDLGRDFDGFGEASEILAGLDVLICVDTAMAHLMAAMKQETWVMLPRVSDWRWRGPEGFSPWYSYANLFQKTEDEDDWTGVAQRSAAALRKWC